MKLSDALYQFLANCEASDIRVILEYDNGHYIPGEFIDPNNPGAEPKPEHIRQGPKGWTVEVDMMSESDEDMEQKLYPDLNAAVNGGLRILAHVEDDSDG